MTYTCLHTHTNFCDGKDDVETMCRAAFEKGLAAIGFSSHAPVDHAIGRTIWHLPQERLAEYLDTVRSAKQRWAGKIDVYLGLEVDYIKGRMGPSDRVYRELGLDYVIGAVHYVYPPDGGEPSIVDASAGEFESGLISRFGGDGEALAAVYWEAEAEMIRAGGFDILGHLDLIKKHNTGDRWFSTAAPPYLEKSAALVPLIAAAGCVVEANTGAMNRGILSEPYPSPRLLSLLCRAGVPAIITADAHQTAHLGGHYGEAKEALLKAGYSRTAVFKGRTAAGPSWESEEI
ncbi:MAG: histidinol-phosphatase [Treponema sp.]|jgi:histidinol-phosphatase (PHP family)|nr:histidinol-phosphatase [Treponema sp.]